MVLFLTFVPAVSAHIFGSCGSPGDGTLVVWENVIGDTSDGNDKWWAMCRQVPGFGYPDLRQISTDPYDCHRPGVPGGTWNDCISSVQYWLPSSLWRVCIYRDLAYSNLSYWVQGPAVGVRVNVSPNDDATSIRLRNDGQC
jgi:hypothetical protein